MALPFSNCGQHKAKAVWPPRWRLDYLPLWKKYIYLNTLWTLRLGAVCWRYAFAILKFLVADFSVYKAGATDLKVYVRKCCISWAHHGWQVWRTDFGFSVSGDSEKPPSVPLNVPLHPTVTGDTKSSPLRIPTSNSTPRSTTYYSLSSGQMHTSPHWSYAESWGKKY